MSVSKVLYMLLCAFLAQARHETQSNIHNHFSGTSLALRLSRSAPEEGEHETAHIQTHGSPHEEHKEAKHHSEKGKEKNHHESEEEIDPKQDVHAGFVCAVVLMSTLLSLSYGTCVMNYSQRSKVHTWQFLDDVLSIFVAVVFYQAFDRVIDMHNLMPHHELLAGMVNTLVVLAFVLLISWKWNDDKIHLAVTLGLCTHVLAFSGLHFSRTLQHEYGRELWQSFLCVVVVLLIVTLIAAGAQKVTSLYSDDGNYYHKISKVLMDMMAMSTSFVWTVAIRSMIVGERAPAFEDHGLRNPHSLRDRVLFGFYTVAIFVLAVIMLKFSKLERRTAGLAKFYRFITTFLTLCVAWAVLYWGEWQILETWFVHMPIFGAVIFAVICTMLSLTLLLILAVVREFMDSQQRKVLVISMGLVVGFTWELAFDSSIEMISFTLNHPWWFKPLSAVLVGLLVFPIYAWNVKPHVLAITKGSRHSQESTVEDTTDMESTDEETGPKERA